jgi:hypothetical protein
MGKIHLKTSPSIASPRPTKLCSMMLPSAIARGSTARETGVDRKSNIITPSRLSFS